MYQFTCLVQISHHMAAFGINIRVLPVIRIFTNDRILKPGSRYGIFSNEFHNNDIVFKKVGFWSFNFTTLTDSFEISDFLFCPKFDHFTRVTLAVAVSEPEFSTNILFSVLKDQNTRFKYFDSEFNIWLTFRYHIEGLEVLAPALGSVDVGFFPCAYATIEIANFFVLDEFMKDYKG